MARPGSLPIRESDEEYVMVTESGLQSVQRENSPSIQNVASEPTKCSST